MEGDALTVTASFLELKQLMVLRQVDRLRHELLAASYEKRLKQLAWCLCLKYKEGCLTHTWLEVGLDCERSYEGSDTTRKRLYGRGGEMVRQLVKLGQHSLEVDGQKVQVSLGPTLIKRMLIVFGRLEPAPPGWEKLVVLDAHCSGAIAIGPQGPTGMQGPMGAQGPMGCRGSRGATGLIGPRYNP